MILRAQCLKNCHPSRTGAWLYSQQRHLRCTALPIRLRLTQRRLWFQPRLPQSVRGLSVRGRAELPQDRRDIRASALPYARQRHRDRQSQLPRLRHDPSASLLSLQTKNSATLDSPNTLNDPTHQLIRNYENTNQTKLLIISSLAAAWLILL